MKKSLIISEADNIAALTENDRVVEFFVNRGELLLGDIYVAIVENILPGIDAAFVNLGKDKMGFLHANDIPGEGALRERLVPKQKLLVQITKEPTGHKGPRVSTAVSLPGRFLVLVPEERGISISRRIAEAKERARLKSVVTLMKPPGVGVIIRTEAKGQNEASLFEDFELLWDRWQTIVSEGEASIGPKLVYRDQDLLYRVIRDAYSTEVTEIIVDSADGQRRAQEFMSGWAGRATKVLQHSGDEPLLIAKGIDKDIEGVLSERAELPSGGHLNIQPTEALTVIDVNSGRFTSSRTQAETVRRTNMEAAQEIPRQLRLRNIGGMVIVDFIDMESRRDQQQVLELFNRSLEDDRAKPQVGQMSDLGLVELTRRRQGQSLRELFAMTCPHCTGTGVMPTLTLGSGESRRIISLASKEEESSPKGRSGQRRQPSGRGGNQVLRGISATGNRLRENVRNFEHGHEEAEENEEINSAVPEDILEQMPEDLLNDNMAIGQTSPTSIHKQFSDEADNEGEDFEDHEETIVLNIGSSPANDVYESVSEEENTNTFKIDFGRSTGFDEQPEVEVPPPQLPDSDYETEIDPVTGIYRLKSKQNENEQPVFEEENSAFNRPALGFGQGLFQFSSSFGQDSSGFAKSNESENKHQEWAGNNLNEGEQLELPLSGMPRTMNNDEDEANAEPQPAWFPKDND